MGNRGVPRQLYDAQVVPAGESAVAVGAEDSGLGPSRRPALGPPAERFDRSIRGGVVHHDHTRRNRGCGGEGLQARDGVPQPVPVHDHNADRHRSHVDQRAAAIRRKSWVCTSPTNPLPSR